MGLSIESSGAVPGARNGAGPVVDGKFLSFDGCRFYVRGVTYGTFAASELGLFPDEDRVRRDFEMMAASNINTVRTYTVPEPRVLELAEETGLKLLMGVWWDDPRYLASPTTESWRRMAGEARSAVGQAAAEYGDHPAVLGLVVGNEIPGQVVRWHGRRRVEQMLRGVYEAGKEAAPDALFSYANYPTTGYLDTSFFDFDCFNVFLEEEQDYRRYLAQLQAEAAERPVILSELGLDSGTHGEGGQAEVLEWQLRGALEYGFVGTCVFSWTDEWWVGGEKVEGWSFGLTREDREEKPALGTVSGHYGGGLIGSREEWSRVSVVVCAYNAEETLGECLSSLGRLDYPDYEVLVVDDGSSDATAEVVARFPVRLISGGRRGLSGARNVGIEHATGEVVAYIDADARADADWLTHLVVGLDPPDAAGCGGPNVSPPEDSLLSRCIAQAPGGAIHVLLDNERAEHVPGCNMAFWRERLLEIGGFDPIYRAAGDDVDVCWKLQDLGYTIRFHPSALVWHHARSGIRGFWRQQVGYGRAEALVAREHPDKFNALGQAIWRGVIYGPSSVLPGRSFIYSGRFGEAPFQRLYQERSGLHVLPVLYLILGLLVLTFVTPVHLPLLAAVSAGLAGVCLWHGMRAAERQSLYPRWATGPLIGLLHVLQPVAREWGRVRGRRLSFPQVKHLKTRFPAARRVSGGVFAVEGVNAGERAEFLEELRDRLRVRRLRAVVAAAWDEVDLVCNSALFWQERLTSYAEWDTVYLKTVRRPRMPRLAVTLTLALVLAGAWALSVLPWALATLAALFVADGWLLVHRVRRAITEGSEELIGS